MTDISKLGNISPEYKNQSDSYKYISPGCWGNKLAPYLENSYPTCRIPVMVFGFFCFYFLFYMYILFVNNALTNLSDVGILLANKSV